MYKSLLYHEEFIREKLSDSQHRTLKWYTGGNFDEFNNAIRREEKLTEFQQEHLERLDEIFYITPPLEEPIIVYKGKSSDKVYSDKSFVSTSLDYKQATYFARTNCCVLQITVSPGSKVLPLRSISREPHEEEVLLNRNGHMMITGETIRDEMKIIFCSYLPEKAVDIKQLDRVLPKLDDDLIVERIIEYFKDDDVDDIDDFTITDFYNRITKTKITKEKLNKIKIRLGVKD